MLFEGKITTEGHHIKAINPTALLESFPLKLWLSSSNLTSNLGSCLTFSGCQKRDSYQPVSSVDTSKTIRSSQITAVAGNILSVRRRHLDPASERYNSKLPLLHKCLKEVRKQMQKEIGVRSMKANLLLIYTWQYSIVLWNFQLALSIVPRRKLI